MADLVRLVDCPPGLFRFGDTLGFRSEYATVTDSNPYQPDAYVVESGEYFHGGAGSSLERSDLMVEPLPGSLVAAAPDLYAALKAARAFIIVVRDDYGPILREKADADLAKINAALANAEGRS